MAKLPKAARKAVKESEGGGFAPVPPGTYLARISEIDTDAKGASGPAWNFTFLIKEPKKYKGRKLWRWCGLAENAVWTLNEILEATEFDENVDSDDLIGEEVLLAVSQGTIQKGPKRGQTSNNIDRVMGPNDGEVSVEDDDDESGDDGSNDIEGEEEGEPEESEEEGEPEESEEEEEPPKKKKPGKKPGKKKPAEDDDFEF